MLAQGPDCCSLSDLFVNTYHVFCQTHGTVTYYLVCTHHLFYHHVKQSEFFSMKSAKNFKG